MKEKIDTSLTLPTCPYCSRQISQSCVDNTMTYNNDYVKWFCACGKAFFTTTIMRFVTDWNQKRRHNAN